MTRAGLSRASVAEEAARFCDEHGYPELSLAAVAKRLGVTVPSLYKHVRGLTGLRRDVAVLGAGELGRALERAAIGRSGAEALHAVTHAYRDYARAHPGRYAALQSPPDPTDDEAIGVVNATLEVMFAVLRGMDIPEESMVDAVRALRSAMHGFVALETSGGFGLPQDIDHSFEVLVAGLTRAMADWPGRPEETDTTGGQREGR
ncbi:TetR/AcrR family transcriptional regulator [Salinactinospora qingdaonensis]|uniref:TetR/AcrR family transcriptional regulator n=1 Tax=Salinactinospora qingdaonensis TaxID=702744 RepID=A0ABP7GL50_9ACTN